MKTSCYIILYSDYGFLDLLLEILNNNIDEIVIIDGPYNYCVPILKKLNLYYEQDNSPIKIFLNKYTSKIKYFYKHFENEKEKRIFGYEQCTGDIILLADTDEIYLINNNTINTFYNSNKSVISFDIYNMCRYNIAFDKKCKKFIMFKKKNINALEHLSYTWLVGIDGLLPKKIELMDLKNTIGTIYHQTLNREKQFSIIKYIFYTRLWHCSNNIDKKNYISNIYDIDKLMEKYNINNIINIFYHTRFDLINLPQPNLNKILYEIKNDSIDLSKFKNNHIESYFKENSIILQDLPFIFYLPKTYYNNEINIKFVVENLKQCSIKIYEITLNNIWTSYSYDINIENDFFNIKQILKSDKIIDIVIELVCKTNIEFNGQIKNIYNLN